MIALMEWQLAWVFDRGEVNMIHAKISFLLSSLLPFFLSVRSSLLPCLPAILPSVSFSPLLSSSLALAEAQPNGLCPSSYPVSLTWFDQNALLGDCVLLCSNNYLGIL